MKRKNLRKSKENTSEKRRQPGIVTLLISVIIIGLCALAIALFLSGCAANNNYEEKSTVNHVFLFMGDGMGINHVVATRYLDYVEENSSSSNSVWSENSFDTFPNIGIMTTHNAEMNVTDSSAAATAMFTGKKTYNEALNCNPITGDNYTPLAKKLSDEGVAVGVVSTATLEHASPAALYAVSENRYYYDEIAYQGISCGWLDFWGGGGFIWDQDVMGEKARDAGFFVADTVEEIRMLDPYRLPILIAAADDVAFPYMAYEIDRSRAAKYGKDTISFSQIVSKAIDCFSQESRFFLFAEAAKIDTASSCYDLAGSLHEVKALDDAVSEAVEFYEENPEDTLIIVLSDHETGGLRLRTDMNAEELTTQVASAVRFRSIMEPIYEAQTPFEEAMEKVEHYFGMYLEDLDEEALKELEEEYISSMTKNLSVDDRDPFTTALCKLKNERAQISFASESHTSQPVMVYALGKRAELFSGLYDNTDIYFKLLEVMGIAEK